LRFPFGAPLGRDVMHSATGLTGDQLASGMVPRLVRARQRGAWRKQGQVWVSPCIILGDL
jgi:hypothetical protein